MDQGSLFEATVTHLDALLDHHDRGTDPLTDYDFLLASSDLRKLFLDQHPLLHQATRALGLHQRVVFEVSKPFKPWESDPDDPLLDIWATMDGISPRLTPVQTGTELPTLDQFLANEIALVDRRSVTVRDLIRQLANVEGGIHPGRASTDLELALTAINNTSRVFGYEAVGRSLLGIVDVVVVAMMPLT